MLHPFPVTAGPHALSTSGRRNLRLSHPLLIMLVHVTSLQGTLLIKVEFYVDFEHKMPSYYGLQSITSVASVLVKGRAWLLIFLILFRVD
jgi:hypothetical protein